MSSLGTDAPNNLLPKRSDSDEITELHAQLEGEKREREDMIRQHAMENERKENIIRKLGEKFGIIQHELRQAKKEKEIIEKENYHLRKLVHERGKEIKSLPSESTSSYDKEAAFLFCDKTDNNVSQEKIDQPRFSSAFGMTSAGNGSTFCDNKVGMPASEGQEKATIKRMFQESEEKRAMLKIHLEKIERDHDETITVLEQCFEEMKVMTGSNKAKEANRRAIFWEANRCLSQQRNTYLRNCRKMAWELHILQSRVKELESSKPSLLDQEYGESKNESMSKDIVVVVENSKQALLSRDEKFRHEFEKESIDMEDKLKKEILDLNKTISEKEYVISCLRKDLNRQRENEDIVERSKAQIHTATLEHSQKREKSVEHLEQSLSSDDPQSITAAVPSQRNDPFLKESNPDFISPMISNAGLEEEVISIEKPLEIKEEEPFDTERGASIKALEETVDKQEATINLLNINCHMLEKAIIAKDKEIKDMVIRMEHLQDVCKENEIFIGEVGADNIDYSSNASDTDTAMRTELRCLRINTTIETEIMKDMIRVLNTQLYKAAKASEIGQVKSEQTIEALTDGTNEACQCQAQLDSLHKRSQTALQVSQAEVAALKQQLGKLGCFGNEDPYNITFEWIEYQGK